MGKKDRHDAEPLEQLDKDARKRLDKLEEEWGKEPGGYLLEKLTLPDLRLLLERSRPLRELIGQIAAIPPGHCGPDVAKQKTPLQAPSQAELKNAETEADRQTLLAQLAASQRACADLHQQLASEQQGNHDLRMEVARLQQQLAGQGRELTRQWDQGTLPSALDLLRRNSALAQRLDLVDLPADITKALIRVVSVLAQMNNIERLWDAIKESCECDRRPASAEETALLQTALDWHNHNWPRKPYALHHPNNGATFDFQKDQRTASSPSGDTIVAVWVPGIVAGSGAVQKKALVATR